MEKYTIFIILVVLSAGVSASLFVLIFARRRAPGSRYFAALMIANVIYAGAYVFELTAPNLATMMAAIRVEYIGILSIPALWLLFALDFSGNVHFSSGVRASFFFILPLITLGLIWTNDFHSLYYISVGRVTKLPVSVFQMEPGPWYYVNTAFQYCYFIIAVTLLLYKARRLGHALRNQARLLTAAGLVALIANLLYLLHLTPLNLDITFIALMISGLFLYLGIFKYQMFDLAPIARERVVESLRNGVLVLDPRGRLVDVNAAGRRLLAAAVSAAEGNSAISDDPAKPLSGDQTYADEGLSLLPIPRKGGDKDCEFSLLYKGEARRYRASLSNITGSKAKPIGAIVTIDDVTETALLMERLARLASTDELTGVDNRRRFIDLARRETELAKRNGRNLAVLMMDLDHFKQVNDSYGHAAGDEVLRQLVDRCRKALRTTDLFCRYGGEEFAVLLPDADEFGSMEVAERLRLRVAEEPILYNKTLIPMTISIGVATLALGSTETIENLLKRADLAMYRAKQGGRNTVRAASVKPVRKSEPELPGEAVLDSE